MATKITQEELDEFLASIPDSSRPRSRMYTADEDAKILAIWEHGKNKALGAKALGISEGTMRSRYRELTKGKK